MNDQIKVQIISITLAQPVPEQKVRKMKSNASSLSNQGVVTKKPKHLQIGAKKYGLRLLWLPRHTKHKAALKINFSHPWGSDFARALNILPSITGKTRLKRLFTSMNALNLQYLVTLPANKKDKTIAIRYGQKIYPLIGGGSKTVELKQLSMKITFKHLSKNTDQEEQSQPQIRITLNHTFRDMTFNVKEAFKVWQLIFIDSLPMLENKLPNDILAKSKSKGLIQSLEDYTHPDYIKIIRQAIQQKQSQSWPSPARHEWIRALKPFKPIIKHVVKVTS